MWHNPGLYFGTDADSDEEEENGTEREQEKILQKSIKDNSSAKDTQNLRKKESKKHR